LPTSTHAFRFREDLVEIGVSKVGDRALILKEIEKYRIASAIANRHEILKTWTEWRFLKARLCHPHVTYKLTNSNIEMVGDSACFGKCVFLVVQS
jgi:hypothetical protein